MVINLTQPFSVGDLSADTYPHAYITTFYSNGPAQTLTVTYEIGTYTAADATAPASITPASNWAPAPMVPQRSVSVSGADYATVGASPPDSSGASLWAQVEKLVYEQIQASDPRMVGEIGEPAPSASPAPSSTSPAA